MSPSRIERRSISTWLRRATLPLFAFGGSILCATPDLYYSGASGATVVAWPTGHKRSTVARAEARIGWRIADWVSLEASAYATATARHEHGYWWSTLMGYWPGLPDPNYHGFVATGKLRRRIDGFAVGPVFALQASERFRIFTRQQLLHSTIHTQADAVFATPGYRSVTNATGFQAGLGCGWRPIAAQGWELAAEVIHSNSSGHKMSSLLAYVSRGIGVGFESVRRRERADLYVSAGSGVAWQHWRTGDRRSRVARQHLGVGWQASRWLAFEISGAHFGATRNSRVWLEPNYESYSLSDTGFVFQMGPPIPHPFVIRRRLETGALGLVFTLPLSQTVSICSRQQAAWTAEYEWGDYLRMKWDRFVTKATSRSWRYQPGLGITWAPPSLHRWRLSTEAIHLATPRVRTLSVLGRAERQF